MSGQLDKLFKDLNKKYMDANLTKIGVSVVEQPSIPFSSPSATYCLYKGIPRGRMIEFAGPEGSGKTTSALIIAAEYQKLPDAKEIVFVDVEHSLDFAWARKMGVDVNKLRYVDPIGLNAEQIFQIMLDIIDTGEVGLIICDSIAAMVPKQVEEKTMEENQIGGVSKALTTFCSKVLAPMRKHDCTTIMINQVRDDLKNLYNQYTTPGGRAFKHACSVRLFFQQGKYIDENNNELKMSAENPAGQIIKINVKKTKVCRPDRKNGYYTIKYLSGVDHISDTVDTAILFNLVDKRGAWFDILDMETGEVMVDKQGNPLKFNGKANLYKFFRENSDIFQKLWDNVNVKVGETHD